MWGTPNVQSMNSPPYDQGDKLLIFLGDICFIPDVEAPDNIFGALSGANGMWDIKEMDGELYVYARSGNYDDFGLTSLSMSIDEKNDSSYCKDNPTDYNYKFKYHDFINAFLSYNEKIKDMPKWGGLEGVKHE